jgi:hypothetical protein
MSVYERLQYRSHWMFIVFNTGPIECLWSSVPVPLNVYGELAINTKSIFWIDKGTLVKHAILMIENGMLNVIWRDLLFCVLFNELRWFSLVGIVCFMVVVNSDIDVFTVPSNLNFIFHWYCVCFCLLGNGTLIPIIKARVELKCCGSVGSCCPN